MTNISKYLLSRLHHPLLMAAVLLVLPLTAWGQTLEEADQVYRELIAMRADTAVTKDAFYSKALTCCRDYRKLLLSTPSGVDGFTKSQSVLKSLYPFIRSGAGYYSQAHRDSTAVVFAQTAVDIAMMSEMSDQGLRQGPEYPNFVYFVASRTYNAGQYEAAVKYLREYMAVTDASMHPKVMAYLQEAEHLIAQQQKSQATFADVNRGVPDFDVFARESIKAGMDKWSQKDPYETVAEYKERVNEETARAKQKELQSILMEEYVQRFSHKMSVSDMQLKPYDADNQSFLIGSPYGDIVLVVPRTNNEARDFAESWADIKVYNQNFVIADKKLALAGLTFSTPSGKVYTYNNQQALAYNETQVDANFGDLVDYGKLVNSEGSQSKAQIGKKEVAVGLSDVDVNIPTSKKPNDKTFAVIIANERYTLVPQVPMANNDGKVFAEYCEKALGLPKENILQYPDATYGKMIRALQDIKNIADAYNGINVVFFYAGHGIPNESTRDAFLMPIDADGSTTEVCYPLKKLYAELSALKSQQVVVFLDACFSGTTGDGSTLMASARGVALKARQEKPTGSNMVVFSAASDDETAYPYTDRGHGLFTYFLLKKLQDSKGAATLGELSDFITENVKQKSVLINRKSQTPTVSFSPNMSDTWRKMRLK